MTAPKTTITDAVAASLDTPIPGIDTDSVDTDPAPVKRGRGRPPGSPNKNPRKAPAAKKAPGRPTNNDKLKEKVATQIGAIGYAVGALTLVTGNPAYTADAITVNEHADNLADALVTASESNARLRKMLEGGIEGAGWIGLLMAVGAMGLDISKNHTDPARVLHLVPDAAPNAKVAPQPSPTTPFPT